MLEYSKKILSKVSFDKQLFEKELRKAIALLHGQVEELKQWCYQQFGDQYPKILDHNFKIH